MNKKYHIKTFGCQMNHSDSERIAGALESHGFTSLSRKNEADLSAEALVKADLVVFNTCGVRQMAEDRVYGQIHNLKERAACDKRHVAIILTGCLANRKDVQRRLRGKVDLFFPINDLKLFENFVIENSLKIENLKLKISARDKHISDKDHIAYLSIKPSYASKFQALVPIMTGCNNFCAYCTVPHARGREVSRPPEEIIKEVKDLVKKGYKHIVLLGQNVNSYKFQIQNHKSQINSKSKNSKSKTYNFSELLKEINKIPGKFWISFMSNHPKDVTDEMIETVAKCQKVCECFHLPIQSGSDAIIQKMNRKYTTKEYLKLVKKIKAAYKKYKPAVPCAITSDIIVGFPGETKKQFMGSAEIMQKAKYDMVFFGQYSPRPETAAWKMKDSVTKTEKVRRENYLNEILKKTAFANNKKYVGKFLEVLVENKKSDIYFGKTRTMKNVKITISNDCYPGLDPGSKDLIGKIIKVKIATAHIWNLEGSL